ncbi:hypothetical protein BDU57DRAFT_512309 [Ampelomyces quisqualis]|uniref:Uncharacterized protein n=1 Tax=Ampelomyces quisqualis TaxID=50730 RepID=A0A6A5QWS7_AMPQU|nr:hypothetical protein BDU57DRAFT_512309 [Ampelomyces quisqualis]
MLAYNQAFFKSQSSWLGRTKARIGRLTQACWSHTTCCSTSLAFRAIPSNPSHAPDNCYLIYLLCPLVVLMTRSESVPGFYNQPGLSLAQTTRLLGIRPFPPS